MSYASISDIQNEFKDVTISSSTAITTAKVTQWLADADAEIHSRLSVKYMTPITGVESLVVMKMIEVWLVKDRYLEAIKVKTGKSSEDQDGSKTYRDKALAIINDLVSGKMKLTDAQYATAADGVRSFSNDNPQSAPLIFDRTVAQW